MKERSLQELEELFENYNEIAKWSFLNPKIAHSYFLQIKTISEVFNLKPEGIKILEAGPGAGYTTSNLKHLGFDVKTLDGQKENKPDILSDIREFNGGDYSNKFNLVCSFQTLEHIPYAQALEVLSEFRKASSNYVFFSVPNFIKTYSLKVELPKMKYQGGSFKKKLIFRWNKGINLIFKKRFKKAKNRVYEQKVMEKFPFAIHHWEIGRENITEESLKNDLESLGFKVKLSFPNERYFYHHFFLLEVNKENNEK